MSAAKPSPDPFDYVDPETPEGRKRTARGLRLGAAASLALPAQGFPLISAMDNDDAWRWWLWAGIVVVLVGLFVLESRREGRRRRQEGQDDASRDDARRP